jgi:chitodextrinase
VATAAATTSTVLYQDTGLNPSRSYGYTVAALDAAGNRSTTSNSRTATTSSAPDGTPPYAPSGLKTMAVSSVTVSLSWTAATDNAGGSGVASYQVWRGNTLIGSPTGTTFTDSKGLVPGESYTYTVKAVDKAGNVGPASAAVTLMTAKADGSGGGSADPTPGLRDAYAFPNPAKGVDPVIRAKLGLVDRVEITIFDAAGRVVHTATMDSASATIVNGDYCYDYAWTGKKASGLYYAVIHGKSGGKTVRDRVRFAVVR